ncbi:MAG TPA: hypothetical protein VFM24_06995 [Nitrospira sp.]|jgi:hypothetical protein|nr:hypothetical protein [Nitrospira sp.]
MLRHPHYLELPWDLHWSRSVGRRRHVWWLLALLVLLALLMVSSTTGLMEVG